MVRYLPWCAVQIEDLKQFRQWESKTPGHPENFLTEGVEVTTGEGATPERIPCKLLLATEGRWRGGRGQRWFLMRLLSGPWSCGNGRPVLGREMRLHLMGLCALYLCGQLAGALQVPWGRVLPTAWVWPPPRRTWPPASTSPAWRPWWTTTRESPSPCVLRAERPWNKEHRTLCVECSAAQGSRCFGAL